MADTKNDVASFGADFSSALETVDAMTDGLIASLPKMAIAAVVFVVFLIVARVVRNVLRRKGKASRSENLRKVMGRLAQWFIIFIGLVVAVAIVAPSVTPAKLLSGLGIGGVAIGFAFKDILQNFMAGILILLRQPFEIDDQVVLAGFTGTVQKIDTRSTELKTYDGRRILIPNGQVYTNPMEILTAFDARRTQYDVGIGYGDDIGLALKKILEAMQSVDGVEKSPAPDVLVWELAGSTVNLRARWWTDQRRSSVVGVRSKVMQAIKAKLDEASIDMPFPTQVVLLHDQTEETDGDRTQQREGWPAGDNPPKALRRAKAQ